MAQSPPPDEPPPLEPMDDTPRSPQPRPKKRPRVQTCVHVERRVPATGPANSGAETVARVCPTNGLKDYYFCCNTPGEIVYKMFCELRRRNMKFYAIGLSASRSVCVGLTVSAVNPPVRGDPLSGGVRFASFDASEIPKQGNDNFPDDTVFLTAWYTFDSQMSKEFFVVRFSASTASGVQRYDVLITRRVLMCNAAALNRDDYFDRREWLAAMKTLPKLPGFDIPREIPKPSRTGVHK